MQTLPLLERSYPGYWIFEEHPLFRDDSGFVDAEGVWDKWARLAALAHDSALEHKRVSALVHGASSCAPYKPDRELALFALHQGATWASDRVSAVDEADPIKAVARQLQQVMARSVRCTPAGRSSAAPLTLLLIKRDLTMSMT